MAQTPVMRVDREAMNAFELRVAELALYSAADLINMLNKTGGVYTQLILRPEEAALKQGGQ